MHLFGNCCCPYYWHAISSLKIISYLLIPTKHPTLYFAQIQNGYKVCINLNKSCCHYISLTVSVFLFSSYKKILARFC